MTTISFFVAGIPKSTQTGSVIRAGGRAIPIRRGTAWSSICGLAARAHAPRTPLEGALGVRLIFTLPKPKKPKAPTPITRPDVENLIKGLCDSWNGVLWRDDSQLVELGVRKVYGLTPGVHVEVYRP